MKEILKLFICAFAFTIASLLLFQLELQALIQTYWIDTTTHPLANHSFFFTNRPVKLNSKAGTLEFKNNSTKQTDNLFFCVYDSIMIPY
jgi:hypothetical protein